MLLAAGKGERMRPLTLRTPKPLLAVKGKALIDWHIEHLAEAGISELVINVSWLGEQITEHCGDGARWGLSIAYSREDEPLEAAGGIVQALPLLGSQPFLLVNGDIYTDYPFTALRDAAAELTSGAARLVLVDNPAHNASGDFSLTEGRVAEKAGETLTYAGIGAYHPAFFASQSHGKAPLLPLLREAIVDGRLYGEHYGGTWTDVGTPERLQALN